MIATPASSSSVACVCLSVWKSKALFAYKKISQAALARMLGQTPSNFNQKMKRGTFTVEELEQIGQALGAKYFFGFEFEDGTKV